jgi:hypothetical protein
MSEQEFMGLGKQKNARIEVEGSIRAFWLSSI